MTNSTAAEAWDVVNGLAKTKGFEFALMQHLGQDCCVLISTLSGVDTRVAVLNDLPGSDTVAGTNRHLGFPVFTQAQAIEWLEAQE